MKAEMLQGLFAAVVALVGVILSTLISFIVAKQTTRYNYKHLFAETVSQSRNKWLNEMRGYISVLLTEAKMSCSNNLTTRTVKYWETREEILLRLNKNEILHLLLEKEITKLDSADQNTVDDISENILEISRTILKEEWEKVKKEAKGEK